MSLSLKLNNCVIIEVVKHQHCPLSNEKLLEKCEDYLQTIEVTPNIIISEFNSDLSKYIFCVIISDCEGVERVDFSNIDVKWFIYYLYDIGGQPEYFQSENQNEMTTLSTNWVLPSTDFHGLWENLIYDSGIKQNLLKYVSTMMIFSEKNVDSNVVCSNRVVLLHGPPGTGKTSLCKALAQKLAIQLKNRYAYGQLIEINSHSLFSKWFAESGKLVAKMFSKIYELVENPTMFVCVLIDEIESLAHARKQSISGNEPSDAIRVVNAVLTQIDKIRKYPNVLILTTSNMTEAIDVAFIDRADIKQFIGLPTVHAIYQIYYSCLKELMKRSVIVPACPILPASVLQISKNDTSCEYTREMLRISKLSCGFSGRTLRKVPFIAHALFTKSDTMSINEFFEAMTAAVEFLKAEKRHLDVA